MRSVAPALLPVFRLRLQADILAALLLNQGSEYSLTDRAQRFSTPLSTVHGEVGRLADAGLLPATACWPVDHGHGQPGQPPRETAD
jgi:hypothetical protein